MSTPRESPSARPQLIDGMATPVTRSVAEDLAAIFPHEPPPRTETALQLLVGRELTTAERPAPSRTGTLGAIVAAALLGVAAGALIGHPRAPSRRGSPPPVQTAAVASTPRPAASPAQPPVQAAKAKAPARVRLRKVVARPSEAQRQRIAKAHSAAVCHGPHCRASSVMAADERLRRAYDWAVDAGVSPNVLTDYHDQWEQLRRQAPSEPAAVAARYDQLAGELNSMAAGRQRSDHAPPGRPSAGVGGPTQIAALGR